MVSSTEHGSCPSFTTTISLHCIYVSWLFFISTCSLQLNMPLGHLSLQHDLLDCTWILAILHFNTFSSTAHASQPSFTSMCSLQLYMCQPSFTSTCSLQLHKHLGHPTLNMFSSTTCMRLGYPSLQHDLLDCTWILAILHFNTFSSTAHASQPSFTSMCSLQLYMCQPSFTSTCSLQLHKHLGHPTLNMFSSTAHASRPSFTST